MKIKDVMTQNPRILSETATAFDAAKIMAHDQVGCVIVCDPMGELVGIVTDRDLVVRVIAPGHSPGEIQLGSICTEDPVRLSPSDEHGDAVQLMKNHAVRRVPVLQEGKVVGIVSLGDLAGTHDPNSALGAISSAPSQR